MAIFDRPPHICILLYPHVQMSAADGLTDLFAIAEMLSRSRLGSTSPVLHVTHCAMADDGSIATVFGGAQETSGDPDVVILPPSLGDPPRGLELEPFVKWLRACHVRGSLLASVCAGAFLLAETGLLSGREATTHWAYADALADRYPDIRVKADKLLIEDRDLITAGGLMAWTDLGLKLVDRLLGPASMMETARYLLIDPPGREQRFYNSFSPRLSHGDTPILKVQQWLQTKEASNITLTEMSAEAGLEKRTFLRRFSAATGLRPNEYFQHLRVDRARKCLEDSRKPIDQVAWEVGYGDPASFRKIFHKIVGLTPGEYRKRFSQSLLA